MNNLIYISVVSIAVISIINTYLIIAIIKKISKLNNDNNMRVLGRGIDAPNFNLHDLFNHSINLTNLANKKFIMILISPQCSSCKMNIPKIEEWNKFINNKNISSIVVSLGNKRETEIFASDLQINFPIYFPVDVNKFTDEYKIYGAPMYYFIDENAKIIFGSVMNAEWSDIYEIKEY